MCHNTLTVLSFSIPTRQLNTPSVYKWTATFKAPADVFNGPSKNGPVKWCSWWCFDWYCRVCAATLCRSIVSANVDTSKDQMEIKKKRKYKIMKKLQENVLNLYIEWRWGFSLYCVIINVGEKKRRPKRNNIVNLFRCDFEK